jgi:hypothetical protein
MIPGLFSRIKCYHTLIRNRVSSGLDQVGGLDICIDGEEHWQWWRLTSVTGWPPIRDRGSWVLRFYDNKRLRTVYSIAICERNTVNDLEIIDRKYWPIELRRGL